MKVAFEIKGSDIKLSVAEALNILHAVVTNEFMENCGGCPVKSETDMWCCRGIGHEGPHIATGSEEVYEIWD